MIPLLALLGLLVVASEIVRPGIVDTEWTGVILRTSVPLAILAACQTLTMLTGGIDLSVGAVASMSGFVVASVVGTAGLPVAIAVALIAAAIAGLVTGIGVGVYRVHPLIMTLGMSLVVLGLANVWQLPTVQTHAGVPRELRPQDRRLPFALGLGHRGPALALGRHLQVHRPDQVLRRLDLADPHALDPARISFQHLELDRGNCTRTRNNRLAAIHAFFQYVAISEPAYALQCQRVLAIPSKRYERGPVEFLTEEETAALVAAPNPCTWIGRRDKALLLVAVQTGLRNSEITSLRQQDVEFGTGAHVPRGDDHSVPIAPERNVLGANNAYCMGNVPSDALHRTAKYPAAQIRPKEEHACYASGVGNRT